MTATPAPPCPRSRSICKHAAVPPFLVYSNGHFRFPPSRTFVGFQPVPNKENRHTDRSRCPRLCLAAVPGLLGVFRRDFRPEEALGTVFEFQILGCDLGWNKSLKRLNDYVNDGVARGDRGTAAACWIDVRERLVASFYTQT